MARRLSARSTSPAPARPPIQDNAAGGSRAGRWRTSHCAARGILTRSLGRAGLAGLLLLAACGGAAEREAAPGAPPPGLCRLGPDDGPPLADRGIGGTGAAVRTVDRGIGGTGAPVQLVDRGIGGTGIIAVITGFASICLGGVEVAVEEGVPVTLNGAATTLATLRAGQVAVVDAAGSGAALAARSIALRQEVSGPVEAAGTGGALRVAGQAVRVSDGTFGLRSPRVGDWVAVSGLRDAAGVVRATRIDRRSPGEVLLRGQAVTTGGQTRIGAMLLRPDAAAPAASGFVTATGQYRGGVLERARVAADRIAADPGAAFPASTQRILVESYAMAGPGGLRLGSGAVLAAPRGVGAAGAQRGIVEIERGPGQGLRATGLRTETAAPVGRTGGFGRSELAPVPGMMPGGAGTAGRLAPGGEHRDAMPGSGRGRMPGGTEPPSGSGFGGHASPPSFPGGPGREGPPPR